ncbi:Malic acid [Aspergillus sclerotialis]|uniref:Malic acid n=1 Tax=Aspergillus sclerotialis TaxID=2070753 RepID=A0A3A3A1G0_9EURO|nr:Malic acid [Aspergillus sclerotialis]
MTTALQLPRHMRRPGDDGYRTPTIEDAEQELSIDNEGNTIFPPAERKVRDVHTSALEALHNPAYRTSQGTSAANNAVVIGQEEDAESGVVRSHIKCQEPRPVHLSWKKRIRHFTWAFFTLTMATGGIANVLYTNSGA